MSPSIKEFRCSCIGRYSPSVTARRCRRVQAGSVTVGRESGYPVSVVIRLLASKLLVLHSVGSSQLQQQQMAPVTIVVDGVLFDMDGTLIDSTPGLEAAWATFCNDYHLGDSASMVHETHGRRLYDTLKEYCDINDESKLQAEIDRFEEEVIKGGPVVLPGVLALLSQLSSETAIGWTIVTSATRNYAPRALERCGIALPRAGIVTSNDVTHGKPHPAPYLAGAAKCNADPTKCIVIEDAISGIQSGKAAGSLVLAVCTSTSREKIVDSGAVPDYIVPDLSRVSARWIDNRIELTIEEE
ncbi:HAD-like domain-containing protein [Favolaschia claudopus]|uniref:HAD-like domain-containing protein n=1 Tax=Favolaschia claudopus TaxID=2862362 RepID=A0AAW0EKA7_9AGAR